MKMKVPYYKKNRDSIIIIRDINIIIHHRKVNKQFRVYIIMSLY